MHVAVAFAARRGAAEGIARTAPLILLFACFAAFMDQTWSPLIVCGVAILNLFTISVALHSHLFETRPPAQHLTLFYLSMSVGGALGGAFCALIAPLIFDWTYEHLLLLVAAAWLMASRSPFEAFVRLWNDDRLARGVTIASILVLALLTAGAKGALGLDPGMVGRYFILAIVGTAIFALGNRVLFTFAVATLLIAAGGWDRLEFSATPGKMTRSFFGIYSLRPGANNSRILVHGTTVHGIQNIGSPDRERMATSYYARQSGVGLAMQAAPQLFGPQARVAIVGLGAGTLACYAEPGQSWTLGQVVALAQSTT